MTTFVHINRCTLGKHSALTLWRGWRGANCDQRRAAKKSHTSLFRELRHVLRGVMIALLMMTGGYTYSSDSPAVALASSLRAVWPSLMEAYGSQTGAVKPRTSFASSGLLTTQIRHGAPFELFLSADRQSVVTLEQLGKTRDKGVAYASGSLSLLAPKTSALAQELSLAALQRLFADSPGKHNDSSTTSVKITIPNPVHAPYGIAARQALTNAGIWPLKPGQLSAAENAAQTLQFVLTGAVNAAIVPSTLVTEPQPTLASIELPADTYDPVVHQMVLMNSAGAGAEHLYAWLQTDAAQNILSRFGLSAAD
jgi:molybdate transport system substrate-binding protein